MDESITGEMVRWHEQACDWCRDWGFLIDVEEDGAAHDVRDLAGRRALPGEYAVTVRRHPHLRDRFADGQRIGCGECDETGRTAHPTTPCTPACAACLARPPTPPEPPEHALVCATYGLSCPGSRAPPTRPSAPRARRSRGAPPPLPPHHRGATDNDDTDARNSITRHAFPVGTPRHAVPYKHA